MALSMIGKALTVGRGSDKRRSANGDHNMIVSKTVFTANAGGTTTTIVGANAAPQTNDNNVIRRDEKFRLFTSAGVAKDNNVYRVTGIAVGASTTVTFTPAAPVATANGDIAKRVSLDDYMDTESLDRRLFEVNPTSYSAARLAVMTVMDKQYALAKEVDGDRF